ncbi:MAG: hypothetical protein HND55_09505 [Pseudomonadota bacterium]|nr:MAG: hypothetical protein HND55_09505 [Pseudomonadota bacterium]
MLRSPQKRPRSLRRWLVDHPFLCVAILAGLIFAAMHTNLVSGSAVTTAWQYLGVGFHVTANVLARLLPGIPGWLDAAMVVVIGLLPYLVLDALWRYLKPD